MADFAQDLAGSAALAQEAGVDFSALFDEVAKSGALNNLATREDSPVAGDLEASLVLSEERSDALAEQLADVCDAYFAAVSRHQEREREIRDNYAQQPNPASGGVGPNSSLMASVVTMSRCDQAAARLTTPMLSAKPLLRADPILSADLDPAEAGKLAKDAERFLNSYLLNNMEFDRLLPAAILRATKVGTTVFRVSWEDEKKVSWSYSGQGQPQRQETLVGRCKAEMIDNASVIVWPPNVLNWKAATVCGHESMLSMSEWKAVVKKYNLGEDAENWPFADAEVSLPRREDADRAGISTVPLEEQKILQEAKLTELWCYLPLPGEDHATRFQVFLYRPRRKILFIGFNPHFSQDHPYFPLRYKIGDNNAWGDGLGHEVLDHHAADAALWNLELDNLMASAYWINLRRTGTGYNTQTRLAPGATLWVDDVEKDFKPVRVGGQAEDVGLTRAANNVGADMATGLPPVSMGMGDPTMKSGAGTGSTLALIEQANLKLRQVDHSMRRDLSDVFACIYRRVVQYAPDGLFYQYTSEEAADNLAIVKYVPPRGDADSMVKFRITAPSAAGSDESRKQAYLLIWNFSMQQIGVLEKYVLEYLSEENPAAINRWRRSVVDFMTAMLKYIVQYNEVPDVEALVPGIPEPIPTDEYINQLMAQVQELQGQLQQLQEQQAAAQSAQAGAMPMEGMGDGMEGMEMPTGMGMEGMMGGMNVQPA